jgi:hypothetical protein
MAPLGARRRRAPGGFLPGAVVPRVCGGETLANSDTRAEMTYRTLARTGGWSTRWSGSRRTASTWCSTMKSRFEDPDRIFREDGTQEALLEAKQAGKPRYIGFTGHEDPRIHLAMLELARERGFTFDAVQLPLNVMDAHFRSFARLVVLELMKDGIGVLDLPLWPPAAPPARAPGIQPPLPRPPTLNPLHG